MKETNKALRRIDALDDYLALWYQSDNTDYMTLLALKMLRDDVREIRRAVLKMEEEARESN